MKKIIFSVLLCFVVVGCSSTNPPEPPKAKGEWQVMNTNLKEMQAR